jgi:ubiquinone/menaquinone biosynthesis C-methylase UbiE
MTVSNSYPLPVGEIDRERLARQEALLYSHSIEWIKPYLKPNSIMMDVGCGQGDLTLELAKLLPEGKVRAVDSSRENLDILKRKAQEQRITNIECICEDVNQLDGLRGGCDIVHCRWLLAHVRDPLHAAKQMATQIRPGGTLLFEEPDGDVYECPRGLPIAFRILLFAIRFQHWWKGTSRLVAHRLREEFPNRNDMVIDNVTNPRIVSEEQYHKERYYYAAKNMVGDVKIPIIKQLVQWWLDSLKRIADDPNIRITCTSFYQIALKQRPRLL